MLFELSGKELNLSGNPADVSQNTSYKQLNIQKVGKKRVSIGNFQRIKSKLSDSGDVELQL
jgi:hypothetical protein